MNDKLIQLENLKKEIEDKYSNTYKVWFFTQENGLMGYWGIQDIAFIGLNPSNSSNRNSTNKIKVFFDDTLKSNGFDKAHITDFIKISCSNDYVEGKICIKDVLLDNDLLKEQADYLRRELEIIKPRIIVTMGIRVKKLFETYFKDENHEHIQHYSWARFPKNKLIYKSEMQSIKAIYENLVR